MSTVVNLRPLLSLTTGLIVSLPALAQEAASETLFGIRSLALSPDGSRLCFQYGGDLWVAPTNGGRAVALTSNLEPDDNPVWSPDGRRIAFSSTRNGNPDVYVVNAEGGTPRRLTWFSGSDVPSDWSPDGKSLVFRSARDDNNNGIYELDVETGRFRALFFDFLTVQNPRYSADGKTLAFNRLGFPWNRPRYHGSAAAQLWTYDRASGSRKALRNNELQHLWPAYGKSGLYVATVTRPAKNSHNLNDPLPVQTFDAAQTTNVYLVNGDGSARALTDYVGDGVRWLTAAKGADVIAFERNGEIYVREANGEPRKVQFTASVDDKTALESREVVTNGTSDVDVSPDGVTVAFTARNDVWTVPVNKKGSSPNKDDATRMTNWEGFDEQPLWAPDGKSLFVVSDRDGTERLYRLEVATKKLFPITTSDADVSSLRITPDKKSVSFWMTGKEGGLYTVPVEGGTPKRVFKRTGNQAFDYDWSPDMRWVAYAEVLNGSGYYYWESARNILVVDVATGGSRDVTQLNAQHFTPRWSPDGRYLFFGSNRSGDGLYVLPLQPEPLRANEIEVEYTKPKEPVKVEIEFTGIEQRARRISPRPVSGNLVIDPENGNLFWESNGELYRADYDGENGRTQTGGNIGDLDLTADGKALQFVREGLPQVLNLRAPQNPITSVSFRADWSRDRRLERRAAFVQFWREYNRGFYDPYFHGRDWRALRAKYERYLPSVQTNADMATVLNMMVGELEASHAEVGAQSTAPPSPQSANLGFTIDYAWEGQGIKVKSVPPYVPGAYPKTSLQPGDVVTAINGTPVNVDEALYRDVLNNEIGREVTLTVRGRNAEVREVRYRALSQGEFSNIAFQNLLQRRREYVERKSGGKLTYVHIAGMGGTELDRFVQQAYQYGQGKKGMIIDVRNNGGGNTSDRIIDLLERRPNAYYQIRDEAPIIGPGQLADFPMVVMHNQTSFSNAEMFPNSMKTRKLATLVGMPTPGYVIYTYGLQLVDGTSARMPSTGVYRLDGTPLENLGVEPDVKVDTDPAAFLRGEDKQLDAAIEALLRQTR